MHIANLIERGCEVVVYIVNGFQERGVILKETKDYIVLGGSRVDALIYKHAISTIKPV